MAITTSVSQKELRRLAIRSYEGKVLHVRLCSIGASDYTQDNSVPDWLSIELPEINGYQPFSAAIAAGSYDGPSGKYKLPSIDAPFECTNGVITYDSVLIYIEDYVTESGLYSGTDISFQTTGNTITRTSGTFVGSFTAGDYVKVTGSSGNDGTYLITSVAALALTLSATTPLVVTEAAGSNVTLNEQSLFPYAIIEESPNITLAQGQVQTYRIELSTDDA